MKRVIHTVASLLAILIILVAMYVIVLLIHYAIFGNPVKDTQHIIHGIKNTSTVIKKPSTPSSVNASVRPTTAVDYHSAAAVYSSPVHKSVSTPVTAQAPAQSASIVQLTSPLSSDKYDGDCPQPYTTVGRCADKCPNQGDILLGYDTTTGAAICQAGCPAGSYSIGFEHDGSEICKLDPTGCPYGDSVPLGDQCYKNCLNINPQAATDPTVCYEGTGYSQ